MLTDFGEKKAVYVLLFSVYYKVYKLPHQKWDIYHAVSQYILQPLLSSSYLGF